MESRQMELVWTALNEKLTLQDETCLQMQIKPKSCITLFN